MMSKRLPVLLVLLLLAGAARAPCGEEAKTEADLQFRYAEGLFHDGLRKLAIEELGKFLKQYPDDPRTSMAHFYLGECHRQAEDYKAALPHYQAAAKNESLPQRPLALYRLGDCRFRLGDTHGAIAPLREFLGIQLAKPEHKKHVVHATYTLARAELAEKHYEVALVLFQRVLADKSPDNAYTPYVLLPIGDCLAALGRHDEALAHYQKLEGRLDKILAQKPDAPELAKVRRVVETVRMKMANLYLGKKDYAKAIELFQQLPTDGRFGPEVVYGRAQALFFLKRYQDALAPALDYVKRWPKGELRPGALYIAAECQYRTESFPEAERLFDEFLKADKTGKHPARETAAFGRVAAAYRQGKPRAEAIAHAADAYLKEFAKGKHIADVHYFRAEAAFWRENYEAALTHYQKVPGGTPYDEEVTHQAAVCLDLLNRAKDAALAYDVYLEDYPQGEHHRDALERSARLWGQLKDYARAAERYGAFVERYGKSAPKLAEEFLYRKGACEYEAGKYDAMEETFTTYFEQHPGGKHKHDVLYFLAWYHDEQKKQYAPAARLYTLCAETAGPYQTQARVRLAHAYNRMGQQRLKAGEEKQADQNFLRAAEVFLGLMREAPKALERPNEYLWTAEVFRKASRKAEAVEAYERLIGRFPDQASPVVLYWLGELSREMEPPDYARAEKYLSRFLQEHPKHEYVLWATLGLAEALRQNPKSESHDKAAGYYRKVMELAPLKLQNPETRESLVLRCQLQLGRIAFQKKQWEEAAENLRRVGYLATGEEAAEALYLAGRAVHQQEDTGSAIAIWQRLLRHHGESSWAKRLAKSLPELGLRVEADGTTIVKQAESKPPEKS
jgi:TolA-binding protein